MTSTDITTLVKNNLSEDDIKALVEKHFKNALPEGKAIYGELFSLKAKTNDNFIEWQTEVANRTNTLIEQLNQDSGDKLAEKLLSWYWRAAPVCRTIFNDAAQAMNPTNAALTTPNNQGRDGSRGIGERC